MGMYKLAHEKKCIHAVNNMSELIASSLKSLEENTNTPCSQILGHLAGLDRLSESELSVINKRVEIKLFQGKGLNAQEITLLGSCVVSQHFLDDINFYEIGFVNSSSITKGMVRWVSHV